jgi:hypothetical protein
MAMVGGCWSNSGLCCPKPWRYQHFPEARHGSLHRRGCDWEQACQCRCWGRLYLRFLWSTSAALSGGNPSGRCMKERDCWAVVLLIRFFLEFLANEGGAKFFSSALVRDSADMLGSTHIGKRSSLAWTL